MILRSKNPKAIESICCYTYRRRSYVCVQAAIPFFAFHGPKSKRLYFHYILSCINAWELIAETLTDPGPVLLASIWYHMAQAQCNSTVVLSARVSASQLSIGSDDPIAYFPALDFLLVRGTWSAICSANAENQLQASMRSDQDKTCAEK